MRTVIYLAGLLVIGGGFSYFFLKVHEQRADDDLLAFARTVPAPLTDDVRQWLGLQLSRRSTYAFGGVTVGILSANFFTPDGLFEVPWYWVSVLLGVGVGGAVGTLVAAYRTTPLIDGPLRTVDPARRRLVDYFDHFLVLRLRLAVVVSIAGLGLAGTVAASTDAGPAARALVGCGLGALLVVAHYWLASAIIARPMVASTPEGLTWQKALVAKTVEPMPTFAFKVAVLTAALALYAVVEAYRDLSPLVVVLGAALALLTVGSTAVTVLDPWWSRRQWEMGLREEAAQ